MSAIAETGSRVERIREILDDLVRQRQRMRGDAATAALLEANRLAIVYWQRQLSLACARDAGRTRRASA